MAKRWYIINTYSGYEQQVKDELVNRIATAGLNDEITDIQIPVQKVTEIKDGGKRVEKEKKVLPGYVLIRMEYSDKIWAVVRNTQGVTSFVGSGGKPAPLTRAEYNRIMRKTDGKGGARRTTTSFEIGQTVKVLNSNFADSEGVISEINVDSGKVKVMLSIFGRQTPVECSFDQIAKID